MTPKARRTRPEDPGGRRLPRAGQRTRPWRRIDRRPRSKDTSPPWRMGRPRTEESSGIRQRAGTASGWTTPSEAPVPGGRAERQPLAWAPGRVPPVRARLPRVSGRAQAPVLGRGPWQVGPVLGLGPPQQRVWVRGQGAVCPLRVRARVSAPPPPPARGPAPPRWPGRRVCPQVSARVWAVWLGPWGPLWALWAWRLSRPLRCNQLRPGLPDREISA